MNSIRKASTSDNSTEDEFSDEQNKIKNYFHNIPIGHVHEFYLCGEILGPENYIDWFQIIRRAPETDIVVIHINSHGGRLDTFFQFVKCIKEARATIHGSIEGNAFSAAADLFLACESHEIDENSSFMVHTYSGGSAGKSHEMELEHEYVRRNWKRHVQEKYKSFLSSKEIGDLLDGKDIWLDPDDVMKRLEKRKNDVQVHKSDVVKSPRKKRKTKNVNSKEE